MITRFSPSRSLTLLGLGCAAALGLLAAQGCNSNSNGSPDGGVTPPPPPGDKGRTFCETYSAGITQSVTLRNLTAGEEVDYIIDCPVEISQGVLTLEPGVTVQFKGTGSGIVVTGNGGFKAAGTAQAPIRLTSDAKQPGSWSGVMIASNNVENVLEYVTIQYAGSKSSESIAGNPSVSLALVGTDARLKMSHSTVRDGNGYGLIVEEDILASQTSFTNNEFVDNTSYPVGLRFSTLDLLNSSNKFGSKSSDFAQITVLEAEKSVTTDKTFKNLGLPYRIVGMIEQAGGLLKIDPGVTLIFDTGAGIQQTSRSVRFEFVGAPSQPIVMRGKQEGRGVWTGIHVTSGAANQIRFANISGGGSTMLGASPDAFGNIVLDTYSYQDGNLGVYDCKLEKSGGHGIVVVRSAAQGAPPKINIAADKANTFKDNTKSDIGYIDY